MSTKLWTKVTTLSFKTKAIIVATILGIAPVATIGTLEYLQVSSASQEQVTQKEKERAGLIADKLNRFMFERTGDVAVLAALPVFTNPKLATVVSAAEKSQLLDQFVKAYLVYDSIVAFDLKGDALIQSKGPKVGNHFDRPFFQEVLKTGKVVTSESSISKTTGKLGVNFAAPIKDTATGRIIGVMMTRSHVDKLGEILKDFGTKDENYHIIENSTKKVLISSQPQYINQPETPAMVQARTTKQLVSKPQAGANNQSELLAAAPFARLAGMPELGWTAVSTIDETAAFSKLQGLLWTILIGSLATGGLTVALSIFLADRVAKYIQKAIATITVSANEITDTVQFQEIAINQQANSAIYTTDTINELEAISDQTAQQADASANGAQQALALAEEGTQAVQKTISEMSELRDRVDEIAQQIVNLGEQTGQITTVSDLVADLAKQTNMLALKAAVEAARAGESGKGFGVVAGEIRKLADESKKSAQKINNLATDIQVAINRTVMVTDRGTKTATTGIQLAENTATTFVGVADAVNNVYVNSQQISSSTKRQATAIQQVLGAMNDISQGSQESAVGMHRVKTSTFELNQIADELQAAVS